MESQVGYERLFDPQDIFFSTTDLKGVIQNTNRTFDTLSRYSCLLYTSDAADE